MTPSRMEANFGQPMRKVRLTSVFTGQLDPEQIERALNLTAVKVVN